MVLCVWICLRGQDHGLGPGSRSPRDGLLPGWLLRPGLWIDLQVSPRLHLSQWRLNICGLRVRRQPQQRHQCDASEVHLELLEYPSSPVPAQMQFVLAGIRHGWHEVRGEEAFNWIRGKLTSSLNVPIYTDLKPPMAVMIWATQSSTRSHHLLNCPIIVYVCSVQIPNLAWFYLHSRANIYRTPTLCWALCYSLKDKETQGTAPAFE